jgi:hypothetical protein
MLDTPDGLVLEYINEATWKVTLESGELSKDCVEDGYYNHRRRMTIRPPSTSLIMTVVDQSFTSPYTSDDNNNAERKWTQLDWVHHPDLRREIPTFSANSRR